MRDVRSGSSRRVRVRMFDQHRPLFDHTDAYQGPMPGEGMRDLILQAAITDEACFVGGHRQEEEVEE